MNFTLQIRKVIWPIVAVILLIFIVILVKVFLQCGLIDFLREWWRDGIWLVLPSTCFTLIILGLLHSSLIIKYIHYISIGLLISFTVLLVTINVTPENIRELFSLILDKNHPNNNTSSSDGYLLLLGLAAVILTFIGGVVIYNLNEGREKIEENINRFNEIINSSKNDDANLKLSSTQTLILVEIHKEMSYLTFQENPLRDGKLQALDNLLPLVKINYSDLPNTIDSLAKTTHSIMKKEDLKRRFMEYEHSVNYLENLQEYLERMRNDSSLGEGAEKRERQKNIDIIKAFCSLWLHDE